MKTELAYLYIHKGKSVASLTEEPEQKATLFAYDEITYQNALQKHESNLMEVENAEKRGGEIMIRKVADNSIGEILGIYNSGQRVEIVQIGEKICKVIKII